MSGRSAVLSVRILTDATQGRKGLGDYDRAAESTTSKSGARFKKLAGVIAGAFALDKGIAFLKDSVQGYQDHLKVLAQTQQVIKTTGGAAKTTAKHVGALADAIEANTGVDGDLVQNGANMLLTFTNIRNEVGKGNDVFDQATKITTDMSAALGSDLKGQAIQVGKALNDPIKGVSALSKVGVSFTDQQKSQIAAMVKNNNTLGAQKLILGELGKEFGGTAHKIETPTQAMAVQFHALQDTVGSLLLPIITAVMHVLTAYVLPALTAVVGFLKSHARVIGIVALALSPLLAAWAAYAAVTRTVAAVQTLLNAVMEANPIILVVTALAALVAAFVLAYKNSETFRDIVNGVFSAIATAGQAMWDDFLHPIIDAFVTVWTTQIDAVKAVWDTTLHPVFNAVRDVINTVMGLVAGYVRTNINLITGAFDGARTAVHAATSAVSTSIGAIGDAIRTAWDTVSSVGGKIIGFFRDLPGNIAGFVGSMARAGRDFMGALFDGLKSAADAAGHFATDVAKGIVNALVRGINNVLGLPWVLKIHIHGPGPLPDINWGPKTLLDRIPLWASAPPVPAWPEPPRLDQLVPGFTLFASSLTADASAPLAPSTSGPTTGDTTIVKVNFYGLVTDPEATARQIRDVLAQSDARTLRSRVAV